MSSATPVCWLVIPVKAPGEGKSRLAGVLSQNLRKLLVSAMLDRVVEAAQVSPRIARVCIVGPSDHGLGEKVTLLRERKGGLNGALSQALAILHGPDRLIVVLGDLPYILPLDLAKLAQVPAAAIGIAPDRHGTGTNALSIPHSCAADFNFAFGPDSYIAHRREILRLRYGVEVIRTHGLENDIDCPGDLTDDLIRMLSYHRRCSTDCAV